MGLTKQRQLEDMGERIQRGWIGNSLANVLISSLKVGTARCGKPICGPRRKTIRNGRRRPWTHGNDVAIPGRRAGSLPSSTGSRGGWFSRRSARRSVFKES